MDKVSFPIDSKGNQSIRITNKIPILKDKEEIIINGKQLRELKGFIQQETKEALIKHLKTFLSICGKCGEPIKDIEYGVEKHYEEFHPKYPKDMDSHVPFHILYWNKFFTQSGEEVSK